VNIRLRSLLVIAVTLIGMTLAGAEPNSDQRVRAFAKLPDWSGLWEQFNVGPSGSPTDPAEVQALLSTLVVHPPYNAQWEAQYQAAHHASHPDKPICTLGFPALMIGTPLMFEAVVTPEETLLIFTQRETRHIHTDGRPHPAKDEIFATTWGDSVGHWEGQTLVVDTIATSSPINLAGDRISEQAHYIERISMLDKNSLEDQITIEDPIALTGPWHLNRQYRRVPNMSRFVEEDCEGNDRNPVVNGKFTIAPPKP
jgi:hypothetical protein